MKRLYISGPFAADDQIRNVRRAIDAAELARIRGWSPLVPHLNFAWHLVYPLVPEEWLELDLAWVAGADAVLRIRGESPGGDAEVALARERGIPVYLGIKALPWITE